MSRKYKKPYISVFEIAKDDVIATSNSNPFFGWSDDLAPDDLDDNNTETPGVPVG